MYVLFSFLCNRGETEKEGNRKTTQEAAQSANKLKPQELQTPVP